MYSNNIDLRSKPWFLKKMKILRCYPFLPPLPGGMEKHILRLTEEQRLLGIEVVLAFNRGEASGPEDIQILPFFDLRRIKPQSLRDLIFYTALCIKVLLNRNHFDIVHIHGDWSAFLFGHCLKYFTKSQKVIGSFHDVVKRWPWASMYRIALQGYSFVYATGAKDASYVGSLIDKPVFWQHSGIDTLFFLPDERDETNCDIITVGSFVTKKNFPLVVHIASLMPNVRFCIVGDGPLRHKIETDCHQRGIENITFTGHLEAAEVAKKLQSAKIFLLTSFAEGTPTAILEAMASGLAVVTSNSNEYSELIKPGINGYVIEGFDAQKYVSKLKELLENDRLLNEIAEFNSNQAIQYSWPKVAKKITEWMNVF